jgi:drug/metabolite transporter (DMT)-like permease
MLALFFLKKRLYRHHWTSMGTIIVGVVIVGTSYLLRDEKNED